MVAHCNFKVLHASVYGIACIGCCCHDNQFPFPRRTQGAKFSQICKMTDIFEGSVIRCLRRLEELLRELCQAAKVIGNTELENKFAQGQSKFICVWSVQVHLCVCVGGGGRGV